MCAHCRCRVANTADHQPPIALHAHTGEGTGCCELVASCEVCAHRQGAAVQRAILAGRVPAPRLAPPTSITAAPAPIADPAGYDQTDPVWDVDWLDDLRDVPPDATWPRLMTRPHPLAVGSYGARFVAWCDARGVHLRWWQQLAAARLLEHDAGGVLCWQSALVSTARQVGKSLLLRELCSWRLDEAGRLFPPGQLILHIGRKLSVAVEIQRPARRRAKLSPDLYKVREFYGEQQIERIDDGSRWMVRSKDNMVSYTVDLAVIDEAWDVPAALIETDLYPTIVEHPNAQLVMWSTAHRKAKSTVINRRLTLDVTEAKDALHVEWSPPRDVDMHDRAGWRLASPHWTERREELIANRLAAALGGQTDDPDEPDPLAAFTSQWLNWWPARIAPPGDAEPLLPDGAWDACTGTLPAAAGGFVALEDYFGDGAAVALVAGDGSGRYEVDGVACETWGAAVDKARLLVASRPGCHLIVGLSLRNRPELAAFPNRSAMRIAGPTELRRGLSLFRTLVAAGQIVHDATPDLDQQLVPARVKQLPSGGLSIEAPKRTDLLKAMIWALDACQTPTPTPAVR
jgi:hypothetical protein